MILLSLGIRDKMSAAKELLDRTGLVKTEKMQVEAKGGVMLMPPNKRKKMTKPLKQWKLPQPTDIKEDNEWVPIPRISRTVPLAMNRPR